MKKQGKRSHGTSRERMFRALSGWMFWLPIMLILCSAGYDAQASAVEIKSTSAVVMDSVNGRVLYAKNPELRLMPASTTKLMTALVVVEKAKMSDVVTVSRRAATISPTRAGLKEGDRVTIENLLYAALIKSANDAAVALAEAVADSEPAFVKLMNKKAIALGLNDTRFINATGLPGEGQYITAYDLAKIMRQAIKHPLLREILGTKETEVTTENGKTMFIKNTNKLLWTDDELLGGKTGYTAKARHCFVCAGERENSRIVTALLGAPSRDLLWTEAEELMNFGARVMSHEEEPVVVITRADYDAPKVVKASYTKKSRTVNARSKSQSAKATKAKSKKSSPAKSSTVACKTNTKKKPVTTAQKKTGKTTARKKQGTNRNIAKKGSDGTNG